jgi:HEPN domain-containing protein
LPKQPPRTRPVTTAQAEQYLGKAEEFLASAKNDLTEGRMIAATSSAVHAAISAGDAVTAIRSGQRSAGEAHSQAMELLRASGPDGVELAKELNRLVGLKPKAEYDPSEFAPGTARQAVERAGRCVDIARRVLASHK